MKKITYITPSIKNNTIVRWPDNCMPLTIYIASFRWYKAKGQEFKYKNMVLQALQLWEEASEGKISFQIVNTLNESQINIDWKRVDRTSLGHCYFNYDSQGRFYSAEVQIGLSDGIIHKQYQDESEVYHTIVHEIGHAIGLNHSPYKEDIMYVPHQYGNVKVSQRDKDTLKWLYRFPYGVEIQQITANYNFPQLKNLDELVLNLQKNKNKSKFENIKNEINTDNSKKLEEDNQILADINKYNLAIQNLNINFKAKDNS